MRLFINPPSPYARKVVAMAHELGLAGRIQIVKVDPWTDPPELIQATPLCRVPALVSEAGALVVESTTICEYLMERASSSFPTARARLEVLGRAAIAHGVMDAAFSSVIEKRRPNDLQWPQWIERQYRALTRTLPTIAVPQPDRFDLGDVTLACALAYLDFRVSNVEWRPMRPDLAAWLDRVAERVSMVASRP